MSHSGKNKLVASGVSSSLALLSRPGRAATGGLAGGLELSSGGTDPQHSAIQSWVVDLRDTRELFLPHSYPRLVLGSKMSDKDTFRPNLNSTGGINFSSSWFDPIIEGAGEKVEGP